MDCDYETNYRCGDGEHNLLKKILGRLAQLVGLAGGGGGVGDTVTLTVSDIQIGAVEIKDGDTDARAKIITTCPLDTDRGLVVRNIPCGVQAVSGPLTDAQLSARVNTLGQKTMAGSTSVVIAADQPPIPFILSGAAFIGVCPGEFDTGLVVRNIPCGTQAVSVASMPLPAGAATEATLSSLESLTSIYFPAFEAQLAYLSNLDVQLSTLVRTTCPSGADAALAVRNIPCGTQAISAVSLPLPAGAATEVTVGNILGVNTFYLPSIDNWLGQIAGLIRTTCPSGADVALAVRNIPCGTQAISAVSLPLPAGAATEVTLANIDLFTSFYLPDISDILNSALPSLLTQTSFEARTPTLGQKTMAGSSPVVIASDQSPISVKSAEDATYGSFTAELTLGTAIGKNRILSFFHPVGVTLKYEIIKIILFFKVTHTVGVGQYKIQFTTVESATGTVLTPQQYLRSDANTGASVRAATTADGTLVGNPFIGYTKSLTPITGDPVGAMVTIYEHPGSPGERPITLRASTAEGILVYQDVTATLTTAPIVAARIVWRELS